MKMKVFYLLVVVILTIAWWLVATFLWGSLSPGELIILTIIGWLFASAVLAAATRVTHSVWVYAGLFILAALFLPASLVVELFPVRLSQPLDSLVELTLLLTFSAALVVAALLLHSGLNLLKWQNAGLEKDRGAPAPRKYAGRASVVVLVLSVLVLAKALHNLYWFIVWDTTGDSLGNLWLALPVLAVLFSGAFLFGLLPGRAKLAGFLYMLLIPVLIAAATHAQRVDFRQLTEERAERVSQVIETYYTQEGRYPHDLRQLIPWYVVSLPGPVAIYGQDWCYDRGEDYYRLGYVYREHWSDPDLHGRIYKTQGDVSDFPGICAEEIAALEKHYPLFRERR